MHWGWNFKKKLILIIFIKYLNNHSIIYTDILDFKNNIVVRKLINIEQFDRAIWGVRIIIEAKPWTKTLKISQI